MQDQASRTAGEDTAAAFTSAGALVPPYDPETRCLVVEHSNSLRQNVDAYATNIDGDGCRFDAVIDFDAEDARSKVADPITLERLDAFFDFACFDHSFVDLRRRTRQDLEVTG